MRRSCFAPAFPVRAVCSSPYLYRAPVNARATQPAMSVGNADPLRADVKTAKHQGKARPKRYGRTIQCKGTYEECSCRITYDSVHNDGRGYGRQLRPRRRPRDGLGTDAEARRHVRVHAGLWRTRSIGTRNLESG